MTVNNVGELRTYFAGTRERDTGSRVVVININVTIRMPVDLGPTLSLSDTYRDTGRSR